MVSNRSLIVIFVVATTDLAVEYCRNLSALLRQLLSSAHEYCCGDFICCCQAVEQSRYSHNGKELRTGTVRTSIPLIEPATIFGTGSFYLTNV